MAAEAVILDNLHNILSSRENESLINSMEELNNLRESVEMVALEEGDPIRSSIENLTTLLYQADDLLDKILTFVNSRRKNRATDQNADIVRGALQKLVNASSKITQEVSLFFTSQNQISFYLAMARQVKKTSQSIKKLAEQSLNEFGSNGLPERQFEPPQSLQLAENKVIGRDRDKDDIIRMILQPKKDCRTSVSVIPIVGLPGVGKSTVAKYVYNDEKVKNHFDLRMWIRVSQISEEEGIIREIAESCTSRRSNDRDSKPGNVLHSHIPQNEGAFRDLLRCQSFGTPATTPNPRGSTSRNENDINERRLKKEIEGKLYLLILDDASIIHWQRLKDLLARGTRGSCILVTTRSDRVANLSKTLNVEAYQLKGLADYDSWCLFKTFAFALAQEDPREPELRETGFAIAANCKGVPLTIKVAASLLYGKSSNHWLSFKDDLMLSMMELEENTMEHVLHLSYSDLSTRLKACLGYCSLFPDDFSFNKHDLISLWTAQGFIDPLHGRSLEEAAEKYFLELSRRCFFEDVSTDDLGNILTCKMHQIMHRLACQHAAGIVNMYVADSGVNQVLDSACKHVSFTCPGDSRIRVAPSMILG